MAEQKPSKLGWFEAGIALTLLLASGVGNYVAMSTNMVSTKEKIVSLESRVAENEEYDAFLTSQDDKIKERTIRNEEKIQTVQRSQEEFNNSIKELSKELRALREVLIELKVKGDVENG